MVLGMEVGLGPGIVLFGDLFSAHVYCGQMAGCIRIPLGTEVGLGPGDILLDGDPAPLEKEHAPNFRPMSIVAKGLDGSRCHLVRR